MDRCTKVVQLKLVCHFAEWLKCVFGLCLVKAVLHTGTLTNLQASEYNKSLRTNALAQQPLFRWTRSAKHSLNPNRWLVSTIMWTDATTAANERNKPQSRYARARHRARVPPFPLFSYLVHSLPHLLLFFSLSLFPFLIRLTIPDANQSNHSLKIILLHPLTYSWWKWQFTTKCMKCHDIKHWLL